MKKFIWRMLTAVMLMVMISTMTYAKESSKVNASEEEAVLPIKISHTDLEVDVRIESATQTKNGSAKTSTMPDQKLGKIDIHRNSVDSTTVDITYDIRVTNKGNAAGKVDKVYVFLPKSLASSTAGWQTEASTILASTEFGEVPPNETVSKKITISGRGSNIIGTNTVSAMIIANDDIDQRILQKKESTEITGSQDQTKLKETNNYAEASMVVSISTGYEYIGIIIMVFLTLLILRIGLYLDKKIYDKMNTKEEK